MEKLEVKLQSGLGKLTGKVLRLLRAGMKFPASIIDQERNAPQIATPVGIYQGEIRSALLNAECRKAEALMEWQKRRFIC